MSLSRLRELHAAWCNGSIRADELTELRDMLPEVIDAAERWLLSQGMSVTVRNDYVSSCEFCAICRGCIICNPSHCEDNLESS